MVSALAEILLEMSEVMFADAEVKESTAPVSVWNTDAKRLVEVALVVEEFVAKKLVVVALVVVEFPVTKFVEKRFVELAVVAKELVDVALVVVEFVA